MLTIHKITTREQLAIHAPADSLAEFLHEHLDQFTDRQQAIEKAIDYALAEDGGKGGVVLLAREGGETVGAVVVNDTGMRDYVPPHLLVYIAVKKTSRGQGIGRKLMEAAKESCPGGIALHVEYDNPARFLYEKLGFSSKYAEMRWNWS
jgi:GNAT superfamily N-acetyltransferase